MTKLAHPAHATILPEVPAQPNSPLIVETAQQALTTPKINMPPPVQGIPTTTGHLLPNNMQLSGWTAELLMRS